MMKKEKHMPTSKCKKRNGYKVDSAYGSYLPFPMIFNPHDLHKIEWILMTSRFKPIPC